jgi:hypothetical protein
MHLDALLFGVADQNGVELVALDLIGVGIDLSQASAKWKV